MLSAITAEVLDIFRLHGSVEYGEQCSVLSHSFQAGLIVKERDLDTELIIAAWLHDIGHLYPLTLAEEDHTTMGDFGIDAHDRWGEYFLSERGFSPCICATVKNHVDSKRYLCSVDTDYYDQLSLASKETMKYQGGIMTSEEVQAFEKDPFFEESITIRYVDDEAKAIDFTATDEHWDYFTELLENWIR